MFGWFEQRLNPFPPEEPGLPPKGLVAFCWYYTKPAWPWLLLLGFCSMLIALFEVFLYQFLGNIVDWLSSADRATFLQSEGRHLFWMAALLLVALPLVALPVVIHLINQRRYQTVRWAAMMFLLAANRMSRGYARIRQWLILLARTLAVAGLIVAVARPLAGGWVGRARTWCSSSRSPLERALPPHGRERLQGPRAPCGNLARTQRSRRRLGT